MLIYPFLLQEPILLRFWLVAFLCIFMGAVGVGLEVARVISRDNNGVSADPFGSWPCADPSCYLRLSRPPEKCV